MSDEVKTMFLVKVESELGNTFDSGGFEDKNLAIADNLVSALIAIEKDYGEHCSSRYPLEVTMVEGVPVFSAGQFTWWVEQLPFFESGPVEVRGSPNPVQLELNFAEKCPSEAPGSPQSDLIWE